MTLDRRIIDLYDEYTHRPLDRRVFLERLLALAGSAAAAEAALAVLEPNYAQAAVVNEDDPRVVGERVTTESPQGKVNAYKVRPKAIGRAPAVLVIHENRGLNPYIEDVTRRLATEGFLALAPDFLSPLGGTPSDPDRARDLIGKLEVASVMGQAEAWLASLAQDANGNGKVGAVGFCWGGGMVNRLATRAKDLDAAVVFYGPAPDPAEVAKIRAPLLLHYAGLDTRVNAGLPAFEAALKAANVPYTLHLYEGANHAFHNDTSAERYNEAAAGLAWQRTIDFLRKTLA